jgi:hypothetical protein
MSKVELLRRLWPENCENLTGVTQLLITKYLLKLTGIFGFCKVKNVRNIKQNFELHESIKLNYKTSNFIL